MTCDVTYDVLGNERHKAVCELRKLPDGYPSYSAFPFAKWYEDLSTALGICKGEVSCAKVRDTLIHLLGGDQVPVTLGDLYGIRKEGDGGVDAGRSDSTGGGCDDVVPAGCDDDCAGNPLAEGVAPITTELRAACGSANDMVSYVAIDSHDFHRLCDAIDAVHAQLECDYKVACEANERQDELYADMVHKLDCAYEKNRNQRKQLTEVQEALRRRNEGELKRRWMREKQDLELQIAKMRLESVELPKDADGEVWRIGDELLDDGMVCEVVGIGPNRLYYYVDATDTVEWTQADSRRHHHAPTVEDVLRNVVTLCHNTWKEESPFHFYDVDDVMKSGNIADFAAKLRLAGSDAE